jgi:hypothetical protein
MVQCDRSRHSLVDQEIFIRSGSEPAAETAIQLFSNLPSQGHVPRGEWP